MYSIKNTRVRLKDIRAGITVYTAHPIYGIIKYVIRSKPYMHKDIGLFVDTTDFFIEDATGLPLGDHPADHKGYNGNHSLNDMGVTPGDSYNGRRTFRTLKQAQEWQTKWKTDPSFIKQHERHEEINREMDWDLGYDEVNYYD